MTAARKTDMPDLNNTGAKAFGGVVALVAVVAGVYAMVEPMSQRIDFTGERITEHATQHAHEGAIRDLARFTERFNEIETQFKAQRETTVKTEERTNARLDKLEQRLLIVEPDLTEKTAIDAAMWERIKSIEREVYGRPKPITMGEALGAGGPGD